MRLAHSELQLNKIAMIEESRMGAVVYSHRHLEVLNTRNLYQLILEIQERTPPASIMSVHDKTHDSDSNRS